MFSKDFYSLSLALLMVWVPGIVILEWLFLEGMLFGLSRQLCGIILMVSYVFQVEFINYLQEKFNPPD